MNSILLLLTALVAVILCIVILIQNPKTGALNSALLNSSIVGARQSTTWAEKMTLGSAALMLLMCLGIGIIF